ncbi:Nucleoporin NUP82 [Penicillium macrosclerotiorum]|uniref:Nucleoporin NUP82 n=1 Tax=Penicillium macrosclerotiorum TaxID=303699 RepID=UPI002548EB69|nr:Nucleoporin NUP82 [Penicillium macrosclerotiorum]KAJ5668989.1 Nucleoporin NUP82 [Penicillium macrosclerotiorum]
MPKVNSYAPAWLCRPSPGASLFTGSAAKSPAPELQNGAKASTSGGPNRTVTRRGNEVFAVVDNEIRWSNLARLKDQWQQQARQKKSNAQPNGCSVPPYRVLSVPVFGLIKQILPSPNGAFLAIVTEHTVHIAVLPDSSHLSSTDTSPIRLKAPQLGPTTHVIPEAPVVSALWHPLGLYTNLAGCIVTVTADAVVRVWELDRDNRWSFDQPTLAVDLKKLVDGTSSDQDFAPSGFGKSKGFSADIFDMEVASACFGGSGNEREDAWAPMTLWVAMRPGDLYALCPLLPSKWQAPSATIPSLSSAIVPKLAALEESPENLEEELIACRQQYDWLREIDDQEPLNPPNESDTIQGADVFTRPANPSAIPRLQGPFRFDTGDELDDLDLCDILVIAAGLNVEDLMMGEDEELAVEASDKDKLSATVICLTSGNGRVHICLELDGVEGQWLPKAKKNAFRTPLSEPADLILVESLDTIKATSSESITWPTFTKDVHSRYSFFVTTASNVVSFSMSSWVQRLESELQAEDLSGSGYRLQVLCSGNVAQRERILQVSETDSLSRDQHLATSLVFYDFDLGYLLLTFNPSNPYAAAMDTPEDSFSVATDLRLYDQTRPMLATPAVAPRRAPYQVPAVLYAESPLESFVEKHVPHRQRHTLKEQVRLSPATLDLVTDAHRVLSSYTNTLERAASDLFRRCERLQGEMKDQLRQLSDVAERINSVTSTLSEDNSDKEGSKNDNALDKRLQNAKDRQSELVRRYDALRKKVANSGGRPLSEKETAWVSEVKTLSESLDDKPKAEERNQQLAERLETVKRLALDLVSDTKSITAKVPSPPEPGSPSSPGGSQPKVPHRLQRAKIADAMRMVERESAVIDAITSRLDRLNTSL